MTVQELIYSDLMIRDSTVINIREEQENGRPAFRTKGNWFQDQVLNLADREIKSLDYNRETDVMKLLLYRRE